MLDVKGWVYMNDRFFFWINLIIEVIKEGILIRVSFGIGYKIGFCIEEFIDKGKVCKGVKGMC